MRYYEVTFSVNAPADSLSDACNLVAALAGEAGFESFEETAGGLKGYVQTALFNREALEEALKDFTFADTTVSYDVKEAENRDWNEAWEREGFEPISIGDKCVVHDGRHLPQKRASIEVEIDAKQAFGTGNHETTRMILTALSHMDLAGKSLLDAGCGTGILGIAAVKMGASHVTGYDIDEWGAENARHNAVANHVDGQITILLGDSSLLDGIGNTFDIVVANINRNILLNDIRRFSYVLNVGGTMLLSGFYTEDAALLEEKAAGLGLRKQCMSDGNGWACLAFTKE